MINNNIKALIILILLFASMVYAQQDTESLINKRYKCYVSLKAGSQMSGIKREDFILSNYSPLINLTIGKWFVYYLALEIGYKGYYFYYIGDEIKHHYQYYYGAAVLSIINMINCNNDINKCDITIHVGSGYFYNNVYGRPNICLNMDMQSKYRLNNILSVDFQFSAIMGWDIYQQNEDILPGVSLGLTYMF